MLRGDFGGLAGTAERVRGLGAQRERRWAATSDAAYGDDSAAVGFCIVEFWSKQVLGAVGDAIPHTCQSLRDVSVLECIAVAQAMQLLRAIASTAPGHRPRLAIESVGERWLTDQVRTEVFELVWGDADRPWLLGDCDPKRL